jgi:hypothetical protein
VEKLLLSAIGCTGGGGIRQAEIETTEPFLPEPSIPEAEVATGKFKRYKSPCADQIQAGEKH